MSSNGIIIAIVILFLGLLVAADEALQAAQNAEPVHLSGLCASLSALEITMLEHAAWDNTTLSDNYTVPADNLTTAENLARAEAAHRLQEIEEC